MGGATNQAPRTWRDRRLDVGDHRPLRTPEDDDASAAHRDLAVVLVAVIPLQHDLVPQAAVSDSRSLAPPSVPVIVALTINTIDAAAPGVTRPASAPSRPARITPAVSRRSTIFTNWVLASLIAAQTPGERRESPSSV